jgi:hypothetical protein
VNIEERMQVFDGVIAECRAIMEAKGAAYAEDGDALSNFKLVAGRTGTTPFQVWLVLFEKHIISIEQAVRRNPAYPVEASESFRGRIVDIINYAVIGEALRSETEATGLKKCLMK